MRILTAFLLAGLVGATLVPARGASPVIISEFMAQNTRSLSDEDGDRSDWIEIFNGHTNAIDLFGWYLTDTTNNYRKWQFPQVVVPAQGHLVIFASEKNRRPLGGELHTNFKLEKEGEYLGLVQPDGRTVASEFYPVFPLQVADVSYGNESDAHNSTLVNTGAPARALVPPNATLGLTWTEAGFSDVSWTSGTTGVGYDRNTAGVNYLPLIGLNVETLMFNSNQTVYIRVPFIVTNVAEIDTLTLRLQYEDGMIAYLNGREIARANAADPPLFNSGAPANRADDAAVLPVDFNVTAFRDVLQIGQNVLAFHGMNNGVGSSDLLVRPELVARIRPTGYYGLRYFMISSPGELNTQGVPVLGPIVTEAQHAPKVPQDNEDLVITTEIRRAFADVTSTVLRYRVMYGAEAELPLLDDGLNGDGLADDGVYGARIPASAASSGQMIRWYILATDASNVVTRLPLFAEPLRSPAYMGTMVYTPQTNNLEILHIFVESPAAAETPNGTRASLFFLGEFYDNVGINRHGQSSSGFPKKSFDVDFHRGYNFRWALDEKKVDDINLLTTYPDKAHVRNMLAYEVFRDAGVPYHFVLPVRVHQNNQFWGDIHIVENGDDNYLERLGLNPRNPLYKMYNTLFVVDATVEKKTRKHENNSDLQALINGVTLADLNARTAFLYDNINVPECINYLAAQTMIGNVDCCHKNYYLYRDTDGNGEWQILPWDIDLSFGRVWSSPTTYWDDFLYFDTGFRVGNNNSLITAIYNTPALLQMYQRRMRTLAEEIIQPPGTPASQGKLERRIDEVLAAIGPDAALDLAKWGTWCCSQVGPFTQANIPQAASYQTITQACNLLKTNYLPQRRGFLFANAEIPAAMPTNPVISIGAIDYRPASGNQLQEYVEVRNPNAFAVDVSGWQLAGGIDFTFAPGVVIPASGTLYVSPDVRAFRARTTAPRGGMGLFVQGNYSGQLSARGENVRIIDRYGRTVVSTNYPPTPSLAQQYLRITELMYHPSPMAGENVDPDEFEYVELKNIGPVTLSLNGARFTNGIAFDFTGSSITSLAPGERVLIVRNTIFFEGRFGSGHPVAGQYEGFLDNAGERLQLIDSFGEEILDFDYNNSWYPITDGLGFSLVVVNENAAPDDWTRKSQWRPSSQLLGSPGADDPPAPTFTPVLINEALTRTLAVPDSIEIYNPGTNSVDVSGWYLTDDFAAPHKFRIPNGTIISAGGYRVYTEADFNPNPGVSPSFALSSDGDEVYLFAALPNGDLTGYVHGFNFGAAEPEVPFGRHVSSEGKEHFVAQISPSPNALNAGPKVGPIVISEIMYRPPDIGTNDNTAHEFIELLNISSNAVPLFDPDVPTNTWRLTAGADFIFPTNVWLNPGEALLVVNFVPTNGPLTSFRNTYNVGSGVQVFGPYSGKLNNDTDTVNLRKPTAPIPTNNIPYALVDGIEYSDIAPWPKAADGLGYSLQRWEISAFGSDPANWTAARPTAGALTYTNGTRPQVTSQPVSRMVLVGDNLIITATVNGSGPFGYQWRQNGTNLAGATGLSLQLTNVQPHHAGEYDLIVSNAVGVVFSEKAILTVRFPVVISQQPQTREVRIPPDPAAAPSTNVTFSVLAQSIAPMTYQWRRNGADIPGANGTNYTVVNVQTTDLGTYSVVITDDVSTVESTNAWLYPLISPLFTEQPIGQSVPVNGAFTLSAQVSGWPPPFTFELRLGAGTPQSATSDYPFVFFNIVAPSAPGTVSYRIIARNRAFPSGRASAFAPITALADADADGVPDTWETDYGATDPLADPDGDGLSNRQEYDVGTNPTNGLSTLKVDAITWTDGVLRMQFQGASNKAYAVQYKSSLTETTWQTLRTSVARRTNYTATITDDGALNNRFYRLVTPP